MRTILSILFFSTLIISCKKENNIKLSVVDLGFQFNTNYKVQEYLQTSTNPVKWDYVDMNGPIIVEFLDNKNVTEKDGNNTPIPATYSINGKSDLSVSNGKAYKISFIQIGNGSGNNPMVISANPNCIIYNEGSELILQKNEGSSYYEGYRFIKQ